MLTQEGEGGGGQARPYREALVTNSRTVTRGVGGGEGRAVVNAVCR